MTHTEQMDRSSELAAAADAYWQAFLEFDPTFATSLGDRRFDDRLEARSPGAVDAQRRRLIAIADTVADRPGAGLETGQPEPNGPIATNDVEDHITRAELRTVIRADVAVLDADLVAFTVDPIEGPHVLAHDIAGYQRVETPTDAAALVARWRAMGPWIDEHIANLRRGLETGRRPVRAPVLATIAGLDEVMAIPDVDSALLAPARAAHPDWPAADTERFRQAVRTAVDDVVRPAFRRLRAFLSDDVLPVARSDDQPGLGRLEGGAATYRSLVAVHTSLAIGPDELHATGMREIERIDREFVELGRRTLGTTTLPATLERLRSDPALHFGSREDVRMAAERSLARAREAIPAWFGRLPRAECVVVPMGPHDEEHSTIAYYRQPAPDGSRPGEYRINTFAPETRPRYEAEALAFHESIPGHHLQIAIGQELERLPDFRRHLGPTAFFEGWGLYTERLAAEMGLYTGELDNFGILSFDAWRACRLVVDTGMHAFGWTRGRAIDFMREHTALGLNNIANEVDRYIVWPGQALAYKAGQLEILRLRADAEAALASQFEVRAFHDTVLGSGAVSMATLAELVAGYTARAASG